MRDRNGNFHCDWCGSSLPRSKVRRGGTAHCNQECRDNNRRDWTRRHQQKMYATNPAWREMKLAKRRAWGTRQKTEARA